MPDDLALIRSTLPADLAHFVIYVGERPQLPGSQAILRFPNGYGASVVHGLGSYGMELAVIRWRLSYEYDLDYSTPITADVLGHLSLEELVAALYKIYALSPHDSKE